jgi:pimeloyl-ACP methyl ester carboxylesterase
MARPVRAPASSRVPASPLALNRFPAARMQLAVDTGAPQSNVADARATDPVVLLHGQPGSPHEWRAVTAELRAHHRVLVPTRPGYTGDPGEATGWAGNATALLDLLDAVGIEKALVVGYSWSGGAAIEAAIRAPSRVAGLVLVSSVGDRRAVNWLDSLLARRGLTRIFAPLLSRYAPRLVRAGARSAGSRLRPQGVDMLRDSMHEIGRNHGWSAAAAEQRALLRDAGCLAGRLGRVGVPTVVVAGRRDTNVPFKASRNLAAAIPGAHLRVVERAGHLLPLEAPEQVAAAVATLNAPGTADIAVTAAAAGNEQTGDEHRAAPGSESR